jgi:hypothetical protein
MKLPGYHKLPPPLLAALGVLCLAAYFGVLADSNLARLLRFEKSSEEILALAQQAFEQSPLGAHTLAHDYEITLDENLLRYAQEHALPESLRAQLIMARWRIEREGEIATRADKKSKARFAVEYDLSGKLVGFNQTHPELNDSLKLAEPEAVRLAKDFLRAQGIDTTALALAEKKTTEEERVSKHNFTFTRACVFDDGLMESFSVNVAGREVTDYGRELERVKSPGDKFSAREIDAISAGLAAVAVWFIVSVVLLILFLRRLRHDELEFRRAWWWGLLGLLLFGTAWALQAWPRWAEMLIAGGFMGVFVGLGLVLVYATAESLSRDLCPEKLLLSDLVQRGQVRVKEVGAAIVRALFLAGVSLLAWSASIWLAGVIPFGYFDINPERLWFLRATRYWASEALYFVVAACFVTLMLLSFWNAYLQSKIKRRSIFFLVLMLSLHLAGFANYFIRPHWLGVLLCLPLSALWTYFVAREDLFTNFLALLIFYLTFMAALVVLSPDPLLAGPLPWYGLGVVVLLCCAVFFYKSENAARDYEHYVPEYVSRIAARERFLKELEIARNVQMRFLPSHVPEFPGLELASICRPAMEVGGDYFDFVPHGNEALSVFVGDVSGKGVSAAFFMTMAKGIIKTLVKRLASPKQLLTEMNEVFYENSPKEIFISVIYGYFDMRKRTLTFARAGHNPLIVRKSQGHEPEMLHPKGLAIGMDRGLHFAKTIEEITLPLTPGDTFVFYTDGISESMNVNGEEFGEEKLCALVNAGAHEDAAVLLNRVSAEVQAFAAGAQPHDDFTMVVVKVRL